MVCWLRFWYAALRRAKKYTPGLTRDSKEMGQREFKLVPG